MNPTIEEMEKDGWDRLTNPEPSGRRGLWFRLTYGAGVVPEKIELRAGREGDDAFFTIRAPAPNNVTIHSATMRELEEVLKAAHYAYECSQDSYVDMQRNFVRDFLAKTVEEREAWCMAAEASLALGQDLVSLFSSHG